MSGQIEKRTSRSVGRGLDGPHAGVAAGHALASST
jgi:hypothetical protein